MRVRIQQYQSPGGEDISSPPLPLNHDFLFDGTYEVHGWVMEGSELRAILVNEESEAWAISNRHLRAVESAATIAPDLREAMDAQGT